MEQLTKERLTKDQAIAFVHTELWRGMSYRDKAEFQLIEDRLCMPFDVFHEAITKALGQPVFTHEFGLNWEGLKEELFKGAPPPTLSDIVEMIPEEKRIVLAGP